MIDNTIEQLSLLVKNIQQYTLDDIEDVKKANHEKLVERNELKIDAMEKIAQLKKELNEMLVQKYQSGEDISIYKQPVDELELELKKLYELNGRLGSIVLPVRQMYKDIIDEIKAMAKKKRGRKKRPRKKKAKRDDSSSEEEGQTTGFRRNTGENVRGARVERGGNRGGRGGNQE